MNSLTGKIDEFRDDLLVSVLELWLSAPDEIIIQNFHSLNQTLKVRYICLPYDLTNSSPFLGLKTIPNAGNLWDGEIVLKSG
jgi:hypothetical protein